MKLIKKKLNYTYVGKDGKDHNSYGYFVVGENGKLIRIRTWFLNDLVKLDFLSEYEG